VPRGGSRKKPINHGTPSGYQIHLKRGQKPCPRCAVAHSDYQKELREKNTKGAQNQRLRNAAGQRARRVLAELHRAEYHELYMHELRKVGLEPWPATTNREKML
jgi:hypothetical protein